VATERERFEKALRRLQNHLGELSDIAVAEAGRHAWFAGADLITAARLKSQLVGVLADSKSSHRKLLKRGEQAFRTIAETPAWWKRA
jgi:CHAD domain-containing protein